MRKDDENKVTSGTDSVAQSSSEVTDRVLSVLESEIENIRDTQTRHGWTSWGLVGGIIASLWLLSEELKSGDVRLEGVIVAVLIFSTLTDSLKWLIYLLWQGAIDLLWQKPGARAEPIRFRWSNEFFVGTEVPFIIEAFRSVCLLIAAWLYGPRWWLPLTALSIAYVWYLVLTILWLISTQSEVAIRQDLTRKGAVFILGFLIPSSISLFLYMNSARFPSADLIGSYRTGGLLVAISYLILSLGIVTKDSPVLRSLIAIRRNIAFNRIDINSAVRQAEIALSGMQVPDAVQRDVHPILALVDRVNEGTTSLVHQVQTMQTHLPNTDDGLEVVQAKLRILTTHRSTCESILRDRDSTLKELTSKFQHLMRRRLRIQAVIPEASDFFDQLDSGMKTILDEADRRFAHYVEQANEYDRQLGAIKIPSSDGG